MGQDSSCGICGKGDCSHLNAYKEHFAGFREVTVGPLARRSEPSQAVCGMKNAILIYPGENALITCSRCIQRLKKSGFKSNDGDDLLEPSMRELNFDEERVMPPDPGFTPEGGW